MSFPPGRTVSVSLQNRIIPLQALPRYNPRIRKNEISGIRLKEVAAGEEASAHTFWEGRPSRARCHKAHRRGTFAHTFSGGSLTVEAALLLPLFLLTLFLFWTFFPVLQAEIRIQTAMDEVTESLAEQSYLLRLLEEGGSETTDADSLMSRSEWGTEILSSLSETAWKSYARDKVVAGVGEEVLDALPVKNGSLGLSVDASSWDPAGDIDLVVRYQISFPGLTGLNLSFSVCQHSLRKCWTGRAESGEEAGEGGEEEIVYVTENGTVYHRSLDCSHLKLTIRSCSLAEVENERNESGAKYYPCERCAAQDTDVSLVYITKEGNRYHVTADCAGLKRTVREVRLSEVGDLRACKDCG